MVICSCFCRDHYLPCLLTIPARMASEKTPHDRTWKHISVALCTKAHKRSSVHSTPIQFLTKLPIPLFVAPSLILTCHCRQISYASITIHSGHSPLHSEENKRYPVNRFFYQIKYV